MDKIYFPEDFQTEATKARDASHWTNAQVLTALDRIVHLMTNSGKADFDAAEPLQVVKNYRTVANEIRRRMQANIENFVLLECEHYYPTDSFDSYPVKKNVLPPKHDSVNSAWASLELLADDDDDIVFIGVSPEDYMRTWNRMVDRRKRGKMYYDRDDDEDDDEEHLRIE